MQSNFIWMLRSLINPGNGSLVESVPPSAPGVAVKVLPAMSDYFGQACRSLERCSQLRSLSLSCSLFLSVTGVRLARVCGASSAADWSCAQSIQRSGITRLGLRAKGESLKRLIHLLCSGHGPSIDDVVVVGQSQGHIERNGKGVRSRKSIMSVD